MLQELRKIFEKECVEYFSVIPFEICKIINQRLMGKCNFTPKSVVIFLLPYYTADPVNLSRYAVSRDYHAIFLEISSRICNAISNVLPNVKLAAFCDHSPIDERDAAACSGLGIIGKNRLLINEKYGSYVFIGEIITDIPVSIFGTFAYKDKEFCIGCGKCETACPTKALLNSENECLSAITQRKGELSNLEVELMRKVNTVWGCDLCQTVCPYNKNPVLTPIAEFYDKRIDNLTSRALDEMSDDDFLQRAYSFRKKATIKRNLEKLGY